MKRILYLLALLPALAFGQAAGPFGIFGGPIPSAALPPAATIPVNTYAFTSDLGLLVNSGSSWIVAGGGGGGSSAFSAITGGTNTSASMIIGSGSSLTSIGTGTIDADSLNGATFAAPGPIGSTTAGTGAFSSLATPALTLTALTGSTQCLTVNTNGLVSGLGAPCSTGAGTVNSGASGDLAYYASSAAAVSQLPLGTGLAINGGTLVPVLVVHALGTPGGNAYTVLAADAGKLLTFADASAVAVTLPQATGSFGNGFAFDVHNYGAGTVTITPNTSTINNGAGSVAIAANTDCSISSNGTNYDVSACNALVSATAAFSTMTGGTNTAAAMLVGSGASLDFTGTGTINAKTLGGASFASPGAIGGTTPGAGAFTTLSASSTVSGAGFSTYLASPPAIGGTAPAAGAFTTLSASGALTTNVTGSTQCLHVNSSGVVSGTTSDCGTSSTRTAQLGFDINAGISQNLTQYLISGQSATGNATALGSLLASSGTIQNLYIYTIGTPAAAQTFTFTVEYGAPGSLADSTITCQITAGNHTCNDTTHTQAATASNGWSIKAVTSATSGSTGGILVGLEYGL